MTLGHKIGQDQTVTLVLPLLLRVGSITVTSIGVVPCQNVLISQSYTCGIGPQGVLVCTFILYVYFTIGTSNLLYFVRTVLYVQDM